MKQYDTDGDGVISGEELEKLPSFEKALTRIDHNGDGAVSAEEIANRVREWQSSEIGRMVLTCSVNKGGQPLEGATVTFVPEEFLGDNLQTATGVTDEHGVASVSVPVADDKIRGVAPGWYRVRITKEGENIPAKYNTETILGLEVAPDDEELAERAPIFEID